MPKDLVDRQVMYDIADAIRAKKDASTGYKPSEMRAAILSIETPVLQAKTATENGTVTPDQGYNGLSSVAVDVANTYTQADEGKVVQSGALVAQTSANVTENGTVDTTTNNEIVVAVPVPNLGTKTITQNGTYDAEDDSLDGFSSVDVQVAAGDSVFALIVVTFPAGESLSVTDGTVVLEADGVSSPYAFHVPSAGQWTVVADNGSSQVSEVVTITAKGQVENVTISRLQIVPWATGTDEQIVAMIQAAHAGIIDLHNDGGWNVGDVRPIIVGAFTGGGNVSHAQQTIDIVISQFGDYMNCGCVMQFDFKDTLAKDNRMNARYTTSGGWGGTEMKTTTLPALVNALPDWLKGLLIEFSVLASAGSGSPTINTVTGNKLALRSEVEVFGSTKYSYAGEGTQLDYYKTAANRVKTKGHLGSAGTWWNRSPYTGTIGLFCYTTVGGSVATNTAAGDMGVAPFGCI